MNHKIKEFFNISGYYLRLNLTSQQLTLISYNSIQLDGIKYESIMNLEEIQKNEIIKNLTVPQLYEFIAQKIKDKKITIKDEPNSLALLLLENTTTNSNKDIKICLFRNNKYFASEYENVLSNVIMDLKEENKNMRNEINEIKNLLKLGKSNIQINNNNLSNADSNILENQKIASDLALSKSNKKVNNSKQIQVARQTKNSVMDKVPEPIKNSVLTTDPNHIPIQRRNTAVDQTSLNLNIINNSLPKNIANLNIAEFAKINYQNYPPVQLSQNSFGSIVAYGVNSYHGIGKNINEDRTKAILTYKINKKVNDANGNIINPNISYFGIYDGHGGYKCSDFLKEKFDTFLFNSNYFPSNPPKALNEACIKSEQVFESMVIDAQKKLLVDKSGSCALSALFINNMCYIAFLGDSRGLYSYDGGNQLFQISKDHKPNDQTEKIRIEKYGGNIYKDVRLKIDGKRIQVNEQQFPGVAFPYRVNPGNLAVSFKNLIIIKYYIFRYLEQLEILAQKSHYLEEKKELLFAILV